MSGQYAAYQSTTQKPFTSTWSMLIEFDDRTKTYDKDIPIDEGITAYTITGNYDITYKVKNSSWGAELTGHLATLKNFGNAILNDSKTIQLCGINVPASDYYGNKTTSIDVAYVTLTLSDNILNAHLTFRAVPMSGSCSGAVNINGNIINSVNGGYYSCTDYQIQGKITLQ